MRQTTKTTPEVSSSFEKTLKSNTNQRQTAIFWVRLDILTSCLEGHEGILGTISGSFWKSWSDVSKTTPEVSSFENRQIKYGTRQTVKFWARLEAYRPQFGSDTRVFLGRSRHSGTAVDATKMTLEVSF
ncbi:hypothetical protein AVEN_92877-1 [Araneus ventricosus]|uniref:Uncharacterized protein n=1 Tax=Araneus ventricosus TaxID=182803 RepID=A0A4Y2T389_ARAVE|nr:hypothetical protein AVEN_92877-1 [Araneus ventricosus]